MDTSNAVTKIAEIVIKLKEFIDRIKELYNKFIKTINKYIEELENVINKAIEKINNGLANAQKWLEMKTEPITKKINDTLAALKKKLDSMIDGIRAWYDKIINSIKVAVIKSTFAKMGQEASDSVIEPMAAAIPHPNVTSFLPEFNLELSVPALGEIFNLGQVSKVSLPRL